MSNMDTWKTILDNISRSQEIKGRVSAIAEILDILNNKAIESKSNEAITIDSVVGDITQFALVNGLNLIQEKMLLDKKIEADIMVLVSTDPNS